jgi:hypothetical protein
MTTLALINSNNIIEHLLLAESKEAAEEFGFTAIEINETNPPKLGFVYDIDSDTFSNPDAGVEDPNKILDHEVNFMTLFSPADLGAIYTNAGSNIQTAIMLDKLRTTNMIFMSSDTEVSTWLDALVTAGVLSEKPVI